MEEKECDMRNKALVTAAVLALIGLVLPLLPASASPAGLLPPLAERSLLRQLTPRPTILPPPRPTLTPSPTVPPTPTHSPPPAPATPVVPEPSTLLLLGSAATGLAAYAGLQLRSRRRRERSQEQTTNLTGLDDL